MEWNEQIQWLNAVCPDGGFLQSEEWRAFKEREGFHTEHFEGEEVWANIVEHSLPIAGKYWYVPRGPVMGKLKIKNEKLKIGSDWRSILPGAKKKGIGWVRVEPKNEEELAMIREWSKLYAFREAQHDMQPREILVADISKTEDEILAGMKPKTRYNVRLAEKRGVEVSLDRDENSMREFLRMTRETAVRNHIAAHPEKHYTDLLEFFPRETLVLFVARREGKVIAAILVIFFGDTATYLHGASSDDDRDSMASYLLQFRALQEAKKRGCLRYDFGGIDTDGARPSLVGVTRFKQGFVENVNGIRFPGSYDIVLVPSRFLLYTLFSMSKTVVIKAKRALTK